MAIDSEASMLPIVTALARAGWFLARVWRVVFGVLLCHTPVTAVLVLGWSYRFQQRVVLRHWFRNRPGDRSAGGFSAFVRADGRLAHFSDWPNWIVGRPPPRTENVVGFRRVVAFVAALFGRASGSLWANLRLGAQALLAIWSVTLPILLLLLIAWWSGWQNSFTKGYEQAWVGRAIGVAAVGAFAIVMAYLPMAQARHAATGDWRGFYQLGVIGTLINQRRCAYFGLTALLAVLWIAIGGLRVLPILFPHVIAGFEDMGHARALQAAEPIYLLAIAFCFAAMLATRTIAARIYAGALLRAVHSRRLPVDALAPVERVTLSRLNMLEPGVIAERRPGGRLRRLARGLARFLAAAALPLIWIGVALSLFVTQFFNYDWLNWLNQPLVHLPWLHRP